MKKNRSFLAGMFGIMLIFSLVVIGCPNGSDDNNNTNNTGTNNNNNTGTNNNDNTGTNNNNNTGNNDNTGNNNDNTGTNNNNNTGNNTTTSSVVGSWDFGHGGYTLTFSANGTFSFISGNTVDTTGTYTYTGTTLELTSNGESLIGNATVSDNKLTLSNFPQDSGMNGTYSKAGTNNNNNTTTSSLVGSWDKGDGIIVTFTATGWTIAWISPNEEAYTTGTYTYTGTTLKLTIDEETLIGSATVSNNTLTLSGFPDNSEMNGTYSRKS